MNYPVWQLGFPGGLLIAVVAILHVFVAHFAVGGGAYLVLTETRAYRNRDEAMLAYVRRHSTFFALLTLVFGAVSGVGIWFTIGLVSPEGTASLIRTFVWAWAAEWVFFFVEIAAAIIYAKGWDRLDRRSHLIVGWIYFVSAWMSLFIINGIITYMLTPGKWIETHNIWDGFWNPTYWPSLFSRTSMSILLAGVFGFITLPKESPIREKLARWAGAWTLAGALSLPVYLWWYFAALPGFSQGYLNGQFVAMKHGMRGGLTFVALIVLLTLIFAVWKPRLMRAPVVAAVVFCALGVMGAGEYMREFVRKPWVINGYIYVNDVRVDNLALLQTEGLAKHATFLTAQPGTPDYGKQVYELQCGSCHGVDGYRSMRTRVKGWDAEFATEMIPRLEKTKGTMPPFAGNDEDRKALGEYLASLNPPANYGTITEENAAAVGEEVFKVRCGSCHTINGGFRPVRGAFEGSTPDQVEALLPLLGSMSPSMPAFTAPPDQTHALATYISHTANRPIKAETEAPRPMTGGR